jgi:hypothetical protein
VGVMRDRETRERNLKRVERLMTLQSMMGCVLVRSVRRRAREHS